MLPENWGTIMNDVCELSRTLLDVGEQPFLSSICALAISACSQICAFRTDTNVDLRDLLRRIFDVCTRLARGHHAFVKIHSRLLESSLS